MMTYQIPYSSTERVAVRTRNETVEDIQDSGADASLTTPDDEETVPGGTEALRPCGTSTRSSPRR